MVLLRIRKWGERFENNRTRELKKMDWVPVPNKHDSDGYTELLDHPNGMAHYGAWLLIVQVASKCEMRGTLSRDAAEGGKRPHTASSLARITRGSEAVFREAIPRLIEIGWLEATPCSSKESENPAGKCDETAPHRGEVTMEGKGREGNIGTHTPTLAAVKFAGEKMGCPPEESENFFHHFESMGWVDRNGNRIEKWDSKLAVWLKDWREKKAKERAAAQPANPRNVGVTTNLEKQSQAIVAAVRAQQEQRMKGAAK